MSRRLAPALRASIALHALAPAACLLDAAAWPYAAGAVLANHALFTAAGMTPRSRLLGPNLVRLPPQAAARGEIALTFDDGPDPGATPRVLDLLDAAGARATFFCIAAAARAHPALVRDMQRRGHRVENHSLTHSNAFACYTPGRLRRDIATAQAILTDITGTPPRYFRAPMGLRSPLLEPVLASLDLDLAAWTRRALDGVRRDPARALRRLTLGLAPGDILLMHDGRCARTAAGEPMVLEILPGLLRAVDAARLTAGLLPGRGS